MNTTYAYYGPHPMAKLFIHTSMSSLWMQSTYSIPEWRECRRDNVPH